VVPAVAAQHALPPEVLRQVEEVLGTLDDGHAGRLLDQRQVAAAEARHHHRRAAAAVREPPRDPFGAHERGDRARQHLDLVPEVERRVLERRLQRIGRQPAGDEQV